MRLCVLVARITIETGSVEGVCIICHMDVVARVDRRFDSSTILRLSTFFHADWLQDCIESDSKYRAEEEKPIERYKTEAQVAEDIKLFSSFQKKYYPVSWAQRAIYKVRLGII